MHIDSLQNRQYTVHGTGMAAIHSHDQNLITVLTIPTDGRYTWVNEKGETISATLKVGDQIKVRIFAKKVT